MPVRKFEYLLTLNRDKEINDLVWKRMVCMGYQYSVAKGDLWLE